MKYQFRPYAKMQPTIVTLTGKVYEQGEHPLYKDFRLIEVVDEEGEIHYAFEDELKSDEVKGQEKNYSEEDMYKFANFCRLYDEDCLLKTTIDVKNTLELFEQFKKK